MGRREKLIEKMRSSPRNIRFGEVNALLRYEGFVLFISVEVTEPIIVRMVA